jgi:hypothetical protein
VQDIPNVVVRSISLGKHDCFSFAQAATKKELLWKCQNDTIILHIDTPRPKIKRLPSCIFDDMPLKANQSFANSATRGNRTLRFNEFLKFYETAATCNLVF